MKRNTYGLLSAYLRRQNEVINNFEHGTNPKIEKGVVFHDTNVAITSDTVIESGVHIYRNVTIALKNGKSPYIKKGARLGIGSIIIGGITVGEMAIIAPGAVVVKDVPDRKVAAGVPAKIIGDVTEEKYNF